MAHPSARLSVFSRQLLVKRVIVDGWPVATVAEQLGISRATGYKWVRRYRADGLPGLEDRSCRPHRSPRRSSDEVTAAIIRARARRRYGPARLIRLTLSLPKEVHPAYPEAVLQALSDSGADSIPSLLALELVRYCDSLPGRPCGRYICDVVANHVNDAVLPKDIVELVSWSATSDPDPATGVDTMFGNGDHGPRMGLLNAGINTPRGRAAHAVARLIHAKPESLDQWRPVLFRMAQDPSDAVAACVATVLLSTLRVDRDWTAMVCGIRVGARPDVASSQDGERLLRALTPTHHDLTLPLIRTLASSDDASVARVGGRLVCLASFSTDDAIPLASLVLRGNSGARRGAAEVYAANIGDSSLRPQCVAALKLLFDDPDLEVRREAGRAFRSLRGVNLKAEEDLVRAFADSAALRDSAHDVLAALLESAHPLPDAAYLIGVRVLEIAGGNDHVNWPQRDHKARTWGQFR